MTEKALFARVFPATLLIIGAVGLDQMIKYLVEVGLPFQDVMPVLPFWALYRTWNEGVAFSFLSGVNGWVIVGMRLLIVAFVLYWWRSAPKHAGLLHLGFCMIVAGAIGNIADRFIYGHVIDYILFHTETWSFAVFNLADALISVGAVLVGVWEIFLQRKSS